MAQPLKPDVLADVDHVLRAAHPVGEPWRKPFGATDETEREYVPDYTMLLELLAVPIESGQAQSQQSGRVAKSLDAYIAYELRRAGFDEASVFPRSRQPRVLSPDFAKTELAIADLLKALADHEAGTGTRLKPAAVRSAIARLARSVPEDRKPTSWGASTASRSTPSCSPIGYVAPTFFVSGKTQFSSYLNNKNNRYEEAIGEAHNLRDRYPLAAMGFAFVVRTTSSRAVHSTSYGICWFVSASPMGRSTQLSCSSQTGMKLR